MSPSKFTAFGICFVTASLAGCGQPAWDAVPATGQVKTVDGQPCDGALVVFHPQDAGKVNDPKPVAIADAEGKFIVRTMTADDGAAAGEYGVTIVWNKPDKEAKLSLSSEGGGGSDRLGGRYGNPNSPQLKATVKAEGENHFFFEVK
jgi:hypothetical protein